MSPQGHVKLLDRWSPTAALGPSRPLALALAAFVGVRVLALAALVALAHAEGKTAYRFLVKWDGAWYRHIAENGYGFTRFSGGRAHQDYAFFPLFPVLERWVAMRTGLPFAAAGLVVAVVASLLAAWGIYAVASHLYGARVGVLATILWAALPVSLVQWMSYSESLFTALAAWGLHAVLTRRWLLAGTMAFFAGLTRPVGVVVAAAVVVAAVQELWRDARAGSPLSKDLAPVSAAVLAPLGALAYLVWVGRRVGSMTGYFDVERRWGNGFDGGMHFARWTARQLTGAHPEYGALVIAAVVALLGLLVWAVRERQPLPLLIFGAGLVAAALTTHAYFDSKPRYLLPGFTLLLPVARWAAARRPRQSGALLAALAVGSAVFGAAWLLSPGAP